MVENDPHNLLSGTVPGLDQVRSTGASYKNAHQKIRGKRIFLALLVESSATLRSTNHGWKRQDKVSRLIALSLQLKNVRARKTVVV